MHRDVLRALPLMLLAMSLIPAGDTAGKLLGEAGVAPAFTAWSRFALGAVMILPFVLHLTRPAIFADWRVWLRGLLLAGGIVSILTALGTEPIANVFGAFFLGPILAYVLSAWLLNEGFSRARMVLLGIGFLGVLLVVRPGFGMTPGLGFAVMAGVFYGGFLTASRWLSDIAHPGALLLSQLVVGALVLAPFGLTAWPELEPRILALTLGSALGSMLGNLCLILALRMAPASGLAPFVYTQLIAATVLGWAVFDALPDALTLTGLAVLVVSGLATLALRARR
ncbi:DMT family transporter [uncultured Roseicyclus sp.]|jgi:drug/metabolite transporter (DMT)-like permease|uniref:DMT family transporter n=1 Tax=uncultured Roseicyclus sp. TaxID=543072 RepID=UPI0026166543|nr:DMT family transporter [uncultured Roseicyclus sp.]